MTTFETEITVGTGASAGQLSCVQLSSTLYIVVYERSGSIYGRTITLSGVGLTANAERLIDVLDFGAKGSNIALTALTSTKALCIYLSDAGPNFFKATILSVSGTTITETINDLPSTDEGGSIKTIDSTKVMYTGDSSQSIVLSISGTTVTENTEVDFDPGDDSQIGHCSVFSATKALVTYSDTPATESRGVILNLSGTTINAQTAKTIRSRSMSLNQFQSFNVNMSATKAVFGHVNGPTAYYSVLTLNGNTFDIGPEKSFSSTGTGITAARLSDTKIIIIDNGTGTMNAREFQLTGGSLDTLTEIETADTLAGLSSGWMWGAPIDSTHIMVHYDATTEAVVITAAPPFSGYDLVLGGGQL